MDAPRGDTEGLRRPRSCGEILRVFTRLSLMGFGGVLPIAQRELVERERWLTKAQFVEMLSIGQVLPGPNVCNLALIFGDRYFGTRGAMAALAGMLGLPLVLVVAAAALYAGLAHHAVVAGALRGMGAVAAGLVLATAVKLASTLRVNPLGVTSATVLAALTFAGMVALRWPMVWVVPGLGALAVPFAVWRLRVVR
jgi:chromate transporter